MRFSSTLLAGLILSIVLCPSFGMFLQAITAALAAVPFTGGPLTMTAGLAAAKLVLGSKLLFYLGFFRSRAPKPLMSPSIPNAATLLNSAEILRRQVLFPQAPMLPLPYMFPGGGGAFAPQQQGFQDGFPPNYFPPQYLSGQSFNPGQTFQTYSADGFQQAGPSFGPEAAYPHQGFPPQMNYFPSGFTQPSSKEPKKPAMQDNRGVFPGEMPQDFSAPLPPKEEDAPVSMDNKEDIESFFTFLKDMDDNKCISRLICDIGADPDFLGEFSQNIDGIIGSLEVSPDSRASQYVSTLKTGREDRGGCAEKFNECTEEAYEIVKSVAPSVGIPQNSNPSAN